MRGNPSFSDGKWARMGRLRALRSGREREVVVDPDEAEAFGRRGRPGTGAVAAGEHAEHGGRRRERGRAAADLVERPDEDADHVLEEGGGLDLDDHERTAPL